MDNKELRNKLIMAVKRSVAEAAGTGVNGEHVQVALRAGSVIVEASIMPAKGVEVDSILDELDGKTDFMLDRLVGDINDLPDIQDIRTGNVTARMNRTPKAVFKQVAHGAEHSGRFEGAAQAPQVETTGASDEPERDNTALIVGVAAGGGVLTMCAAIMGLYIGCKRSKREFSKKAMSNDVVAGRPVQGEMNPDIVVDGVLEASNKV